MPISELALEALTQMLDRRYSTWDKKRRSVLQIILKTLKTFFRHFPSLDQSPPFPPLAKGAGGGGRVAEVRYRLIDWETRHFFQGAIL